MKPVILFIDSASSVRDELIRASSRIGLSVEHISIHTWLGTDRCALPKNVHDFVISVTPNNLKDAFLAARKIRAVSHQRIIIHPLTRLSGSSALDFEECGCVVLPPVPTMEQFLQLLDTADASEHRTARRGVSLRLTGKRDPWISGAYGGERQYRLGTGKQRRMFFRIAASPGVVVELEVLADRVKCRVNEVRVYVKRLRDRYEIVRTVLGLKISKFDFIEEAERGYRLNAKIKRP